MITPTEEQREAARAFFRIEADAVVGFYATRAIDELAALLAEREAPLLVKIDQQRQALDDIADTCRLRLSVSLSDIMDAVDALRERAEKAERNCSLHLTALEACGREGAKALDRAEKAEADAKRLRGVERTANAIIAWCEKRSEWIGNSDVETAVRVAVEAVVAERDHARANLATVQCEHDALTRSTEAARAAIAQALGLTEWKPLADLAAEVARLTAERDEYYDRAEAIEDLIMSSLPYAYEQGEGEPNADERVFYAKAELGELRAEVARLTKERDEYGERAEKAERRSREGISAHDDVDAAGWVERVSHALGRFYDYDGPFVAAESDTVVALIDETARRHVATEAALAASRAEVEALRAELETYGSQVIDLADDIFGVQPPASATTVLVDAIGRECHRQRIAATQAREAATLALSVAEDCHQRWSRGHPDRVSKAKELLALSSTPAPVDDEKAKLRAEVEALRGPLRDLVEQMHERPQPYVDGITFTTGVDVFRAYNAARAALSSTPAPVASPPPAILRARDETIEAAAHMAGPTHKPLAGWFGLSLDALRAWASSMPAPASAEPATPTTFAGRQMCNMTNCGGSVEMHWVAAYNQHGECSRCGCVILCSTTEAGPLATPTTEGGAK